MKDNTPPHMSKGHQKLSPAFSNMDHSTLNKLFPPIEDCPRFSGEGDYDHVNFIKYIDHLLISYSANDEVAIARLPRLFEGVALDWFVTKQDTVDQQYWNTWKYLIRAQFGTRIWERKMRRAFETDYFDPLKHKPHKFCLAQK